MMRRTRCKAGSAASRSGHPILPVIGAVTLRRLCGSLGDRHTASRVNAT